MSKVSKPVREELVATVSTRYRKGNRQEKKLILDEFVRITGYHRKHAIRLLRKGEEGLIEPVPRQRPRLYDEAARQALVVLWEAADRICGKRLKALIPLLIDALTRHGHLRLDGELHTKLLRMSASTIDRLLSPVRSSTRSRKKRNPSTIKAQIPIRTFNGWKDPRPGFMEIDLVAHCGGSAAGRFNHTLSLTDVCSGWTECIALPVRDSALVVAGLESIRCAMPFPLRGIDSDNGGEFINEVVLEFSKTHDLEFTRSRPYKKNDQAWIEQKNGAVVRRLVGYGRFSGLAAAETLSRLYSSSRLFVNFFQPSFKLLKKERIGGRVRKTYSSPATPAARLLASEHVKDSSKQRLREVLASLDPLQLLEGIRAIQGSLASLAACGEGHTPPQNGTDLGTFFSSLEAAWKDGEVRPTHRGKLSTDRHWRTRKDPFEAVWPQVSLWLKAEPDSTAKELFERLCALHPGMFERGQLRTLQRRVKESRKAAARRLMFLDEGLTFDGEGLGSAPDVDSASDHAP